MFLFDRYDIYEVQPDESLVRVCSCRDILMAGEKLKELAGKSEKTYWAVEVETGKKILRTRSPSIPDQISR